MDSLSRFFSVGASLERPPTPYIKESALPLTPDIENHFTATTTIHDSVIGMSDWLTVPFVLAAGLSGAVASSSMVVRTWLWDSRACSLCGPHSPFRIPIMARWRSTNLTGLRKNAFTPHVNASAFAS